MRSATFTQNLQMRRDSRFWNFLSKLYFEASEILIQINGIRKKNFARHAFAKVYVFPQKTPETRFINFATKKMGITGSLILDFPGVAFIFLGFFFFACVCVCLYFMRAHPPQKLLKC